MKMMQVAIAFDQQLNTFFGGWADETLSARAYRNSAKGIPRWVKVREVIDTGFRLIGQPDHCYESYISEVERKQLPREYQK